MGDPTGPVSKTVERSNPLQIERHNLDRWKRSKLRIASAMIQVPVGMRDQQWKLFVVFIRQQLQDRFCQGHRYRIGNGASIDQKSFLGTDEKINKICLKIRAWIL